MMSGSPNNLRDPGGVRGIYEDPARLRIEANRCRRLTQGQSRAVERILIQMAEEYEAVAASLERTRARKR